jgi:DNA-binding NtrC family response regulator
MSTALEIDRAIAALLVGDSPRMQQLRREIRQVAPSRLPVYLTGPTGAGKEHVAKALHLASGRSGPFVAFNVYAVSDTMFEDALFGHTRGAFTGASNATAVAPDGLQLLASAPWPGNVRQLKHVVELTNTLSNGHGMSLAGVRAALAMESPPSAAPVRYSTDAHGLRAVMERHHHNVNAVALELGVHRATVYRRLRRMKNGASPATKPTSSDA